ncbi:MAG TPA: hypothetical protein VHJ19_11270, partial [Gammaproteobacteria bacterium]|nr:hypothetical protein [Gammaproteobacteria bacterium]
MAYCHLEVQSKSRRTIHQYYEEGLEPAVFWCGWDAINSSEVLDTVCLEGTARQPSNGGHYDAQIVCTTLIAISVNR